MSKHRELAVKTMELQMECLGIEGDSYNDQVIVIEEALRQVERETLEFAESAWADHGKNLTFLKVLRKRKESGEET